MDSDENVVHDITSIGDDGFEDENPIDGVLKATRGFFWNSGIVQVGMIVVALKIVNVLHDIAMEKLSVERMRIRAEQKNTD